MSNKNKKQQPVKTIKTFHAIHLNNYKAIGMPYEILEHTTLNEKFEVFPEEGIRGLEYPYLRYAVIGVGGAMNAPTTSGKLAAVQRPHSPKHSSLYEHIPWLLRNINEDISAEQRARYAMRAIISHGGETYVAYYLRRMDMTNVKPIPQIRHVNGKEVKTELYVPDIVDLKSPIPIDLSNVNVIRPESDCITSTAKLVLDITEEDIQEILDANAILGGEDADIFTSEIGIVSGVEREVQGGVGSGTGRYMEVVCAQINFFTYRVDMLTRDASDFKCVFDLGSTELTIM